MKPVIRNKLGPLRHLAVRLGRDSYGVSNVEYLLLVGVVALFAIMGFRRFSGAITQATHVQGDKVAALEATDPQNVGSGQAAARTNDSTASNPGSVSTSLALKPRPWSPPRPITVVPAEEEAPQVPTPQAVSSPGASGAGSPQATAAQAAPPASSSGPPVPDGTSRKWTEIAAGAGLGGLQGVTPGGVLANAVPTPTKYTELGRGFGELAMGVTQLILGGAEMGGGGALAGAGVVATPVTGGGSLVATVGGGAVAVAGAATAAQGLSNIGGGVWAIRRAMNMPDERPPAPKAEPEPQKPQPRAEEAPTPPKTSGEKPDTVLGKEVHQERAIERRASGEWDEVNSPTNAKTGEPIEVPRKVNLKTGEPVGSDVQKARPDAVSYKRGQIVDDKPMGRPIAKDRQEIIRFIKAYQEREGKLPKQILIERYDPATGKGVATEIYRPEDFLPKGGK